VRYFAVYRSGRLHVESDVTRNGEPGDPNLMFRTVGVSGHGQHAGMGVAERPESYV